MAAIARNVQSHVLFTQFVGRAVCKVHPNEAIDALLISHAKYKQRKNYDEFMRNKIVDVEQEDIDNND